MPVTAFVQSPNRVRQELTREPPPERLELAAHVEAVFGDGVHDLAGLVTGLSRRGSRSPDGKAWTEASFAAVMARFATAD